MYELELIFEDILLYIPNIIKALILFLIAWGVAVLIKNLLTKLLLKMNLQDHLAKRSDSGDPVSGKEKVKSIAQIAYFLVFLLFIPSILDALDMQSVSAPISNMMNNLLGFIPRLIGAGIVIFIGYFLAKIIRDLTFSFLKTINIDKWYNKISPNLSTSSVDQEQKMTLADVLSKVVFGIVLIPVITMALEALKIRTLTEPILVVLNKVMLMIPNIFVAILLIVLGYYLANFVSQILEQLLARMGIERVYSWIEEKSDGDLPSFNLSKIIGNIVKALIILFITVEALSVLQLDVLNTIGYSIIGYLPLIVSGLIIIGLGLVGGYFVEGLINKYARSPFTAAIAKYIIIIFSVFMTLEQIKFASSIVNIAFLLILGGLSVAFALSFGLGGRDFANRQLKKFEEKVENENKSTKETHENYDNYKMIQDLNDPDITNEENKK
ncbi:MAG: mechanosensitive ion channel [Tissierella sp.]|uniref:mechanosensitive ion channel n=1 Tax=Tissierella sp. TaxID=41274 RepID=UPI003F9D5D9E